MSEKTNQSVRLADSAELADSLPSVELEVSHADRKTAYTLSHVDFLIGTVPGCDLRVSGVNLPAVLCLLARRPEGLTLRKLAPTQVILVNGQTVTRVDLNDNDRVTIGAMDLFVHIKNPNGERRGVSQPVTPPSPPLPIPPAPDTAAEEKLAADRRDLDARLRQYQTDLIRLDRLQGSLEEREKRIAEQQSQLAEQQRQWDAKVSQLKNESTDLEEQINQYEELRAALKLEAERLEKQKQDQEKLAATLAQHTAAFEGQQTALATMRSRLERIRDEIRAREQEFDQERARQEAAQDDLAQREGALTQLREQLESEQQLRAVEHDQLTERAAVLEAAVAQMRKAQDKLAEQDQVNAQRAEELHQCATALAEKEGTIETTLRQLTDAKEQLDLERQNVRERTQALTQADLAREALQEQLRKRSEELSLRQKALDDKVRAYEDQVAGIEERKAEIESCDREQKTQIETLQKLQAEQSLRAEHHRQQFEQLQNLGKEVAATRKAITDERAAIQTEHESWQQSHAQKQAEMEALRQEAISLARQLPDVELRAGTALERLSHARTQLREHLDGLHAYVQESRADLSGIRAQEQALLHSQEDHRLAMVAFRQQMIGWQGQITELRRLLATDATRLERRHAQVDERAKEVGAASEELAEKAEALQLERYEVADKRQEMDRHLLDMRAWYRRKLRELAGIHDDPAESAAAPRELTPVASDRPSSISVEAGADNDEALIPTGRDILSLTEPVDSGDRNLGELLTTLQFIDATTLSALLVEARRQRRSLRQVLLASGAVTLYQLALIEAGNVAGLMLGPVRVVDRIHAAQHETVYRVFDPRRGCEAVLRHLAEEDMLDAVRPDEFRQRFTQASLTHPHLVATLEVLDIAGRPAVLQEWLAGLPSVDWPPLVAVPGVCFRLFTQAALALDTLHKAGLAHGSFGEGSIFLTSDGIVKISGANEPNWLRTTPSPEGTADARADLRALGQIVSNWCTPTGVRKGPKTKPLPETLVAILYRLAADGYASAGDLLDDLDRTSTDIPPNAEAWDRLLRHIREHATADGTIRRSA